jgi:hypothetical protein
VAQLLHQSQKQWNKQDRGGAKQSALQAKQLLLLLIEQFDLISRPTDESVLRAEALVDRLLLEI